eukprot:3637283-Amphidinium_carterae.2
MVNLSSKYLFWDLFVSPVFGRFRSLSEQYAKASKTAANPQDAEPVQIDTKMEVTPFSVKGLLDYDKLLQAA